MTLTEGTRVIDSLSSHSSEPHPHSRHRNRARASAKRLRSRGAKRLAGWIHSRDQAGRQSPAGHRSRAREGTRCVPAKKTPDDSRTAPMDEAFSPRFRCRASTGGKNLRGHRIPACRKARCRVRIDAGRSTRQPDRTGVRPVGDTGKPQARLSRGVPSGRWPRMSWRQRRLSFPAPTQPDLPRRLVREGPATYDLRGGKVWRSAGCAAASR